MSLDKRLETRFKSLEHENQILKQEVRSLKTTQSSGGNPVRSGIRTMLRMSTLGSIQNKKLYLPSGKISPVGPRFGRK